MYEAHELSRMIVPMSPGDLENLTEDIRIHGQQEQVILYEGKVLDGTHRIIACEQLGIKPKTIEWRGTRDEAINYVWSRNVIRRHLTEAQLAACVSIRKRIDPGFKAAVEAASKAAKTRQKAAGKEGGRGRKKNLPQNFGEGLETAHERETDHQIAKAAGTNREYVRQTDKMAEENPDLLERVKSGEVSMPEAMDIMKGGEVKEKPKRKNGVVGKAEKDLRAWLKEYGKEPQLKECCKDVRQIAKRLASLRR